MKKLLLVIFMLLPLVFMTGCSENLKDDVVRIHIRANSNSESDQSVKMLVKEKVVEYITPLISKCENSIQVKNTLENNLGNIEDIADQVLGLNGFKYVASASVDNEYFPSRDYDGNTFPADYYDALIIRLGSGTGDNWWCVAYPPLCFVGELNNSGNIRYRSKLLELINNFFGD